MALTCDKLVNVKAGTECVENFSGVGSKLYLFLPELMGDGFTPTISDEKAEYEASSFDFTLDTNIWEVHLKSKSGKITSTSNPNGGGFSNVFTGVVAKNMHDMSFLARILNNKNFGALVADGSGNYYVLYSPDFETEFSLESDTGDTPDSDHGHTLTITCSPMLYPLTKWAGTIKSATA